MDERFEIRPYGKSELAMLYVKNSMTPRAALNWLNQEIALYPGLSEQLALLGYRKGQRIITIAQLRTIVEAIGVP